MASRARCATRFVCVALAALARSAGAVQCKMARVISQGGFRLPGGAVNTGFAQFFLDGQEIAFEPSRGLNMVTLDPVTQKVLMTATYDNWLRDSREASNSMLERDIRALKDGTIVLIAVKDTGMEHLSHGDHEVLQLVGATRVRGKFREGYALIGKKGGVAVMEDHGPKVEVSGRVPCQSCKVARVKAPTGGQKAQLWVDGAEAQYEMMAGMNVLTLDDVSQSIVDFRNYPFASAGDGSDQRFAEFVERMPLGRICMVAVDAPAMEAMSTVTREALQRLGGTRQWSNEPGKAYSLIGSKGGWPVAEARSTAPDVEAGVPCIMEDTRPKELPMPGHRFPGVTSVESDSAWPSGRQPGTLESWPMDIAGNPKPCWKTSVLRDIEGGWPATCDGLQARPQETTENMCRESCERDPTCASWKFRATDHTCFQGLGTGCYKQQGAEVTSLEGAQLLQHGDVRVLISLEMLEVKHLVQLDVGSLEDEPEVWSRCRDACYASIFCQYWEFGAQGCFIENPKAMSQQVQYPITLQGGASETSIVAQGVTHGEYIQHFCSPQPEGMYEPMAFNLVPKMTEDQFVMKEGGHSASWWLKQMPSADWPLPTKQASEAAWPNGRQPRPLAAWPKDAQETLLPCAKHTVLHDTQTGWVGVCRGLAENKRAQSEEQCQHTCFMDPTCAVWEWQEQGRCFQGSGVHCSSPLPGVKVARSQRLQHGDIHVVKDISDVEIKGLFNLGKCKSGNVKECIHRCRLWCYSEMHCEYWQYGAQGCWVDAKAWKATRPLYPLTLGEGASKDSAFAKLLIAGEYIFHYCPSGHIIFDINSAAQVEHVVIDHSQSMRRTTTTAAPHTTLALLADAETTTTVHATTSGPGLGDRLGHGQVVTTPFFHPQPGRVSGQGGGFLTDSAQRGGAGPYGSVGARSRLGAGGGSFPRNVGRSPEPGEAALGAGGHEPGSEEHSEADDGNLSISMPWYGWLLTAVACACVLVTCCCMAPGMQRGPLDKKPHQRVKARAMPRFDTTLFRMSATKDRYDYYTEMEREDEIESPIPWDMQRRFSGRKVIVVLEKAACELARDFAESIDGEENELCITHEAMLALFDSPLNKSGKLLVYIHTASNKLIEVHPSLRVPRTLRRFADMIAQVMEFGQVMGQQARFPLMRVVNAPVEQYFPSGCICLGVSARGRQAKMRDVAASAPDGVVVFAVSVSEVDCLTEQQFGRAYAHSLVSVCPWGLRPMVTCQMVCQEYEQLWGVHDTVNGMLVEECSPEMMARMG